MIELLLLLLFNSLMIAGIFKACQPGEIFGFMQKFNGRWAVPVFGCPGCMASVHSWPYFLSEQSIVFYVPYVLALCGFTHYVIEKRLIW